MKRLIFGTNLSDLIYYFKESMHGLYRISDHSQISWDLTKLTDRMAFSRRLNHIPFVLYHEFSVLRSLLILIV